MRTDRKVGCGRFSVGKGGILLPMDDGANDIASHVGETLDVEVSWSRDDVYHRRVFATIRDLAKEVGQSPEWMRASAFGLLRPVSRSSAISTASTSSPSTRCVAAFGMRDEELSPLLGRRQGSHRQPVVLPLVKNETIKDRLLTAVTSF